jgi:predicted acetyltransferase
MQMADPHEGMISFQEALQTGILDIGPVHNHKDLYSHIDEPSPGTIRLTYVRLTEDRKSVLAFVACVMNGQVNGFPCVAVGYAVPEHLRNQGFAKQILGDVVRDQIFQAGQMGKNQLFIEAAVDEDNVASQRVAEGILKSPRESITDAASGRPAYRYTAQFDTSTGLQL